LEPGKWVRTQGWGDADEARRLIRAAIDRARTGAQGAIKSMTGA
jgi:inorganic pyrophosphatase